MRLKYLLIEKLVENGEDCDKTFVFNIGFFLAALNRFSSINELLNHGIWWQAAVCTALFTLFVVV
jgi:hypothetical protein